MRWIGYPRRMDLDPRWSSGVGVREPQSLPSRSFLESSLSHFLLRAQLLPHYDRVVHGRTMCCTKGISGATAYCQYIIGGVEEGTTHWIKGRSGVGF